MPRNAELVKAIERLLRDHIKVTAVESRRDERILRIVGFNAAARYLAAIMELPDSPHSIRKSATHG